MFGFFKADPVKKLHRKYHSTLVQAILAQQQGNDRDYGILSAESEALREQLQQVKKETVLPIQRNCVRFADEDADF